MTMAIKESTGAINQRLRRSPVRTGPGFRDVRVARHFSWSALGRTGRGIGTRNARQRMVHAGGTTCWKPRSRLAICQSAGKKGVCPLEERGPSCFAEKPRPRQPVWPGLRYSEAPGLRSTSAPATQPAALNGPRLVSSPRAEPPRCRQASPVLPLWPAAFLVKES